MRPRIESARDLLPTLLRRNPGVRALQLAALAQVSPATMVRILGEDKSSVIRIGNTSSTRYFLRRPLRGLRVAIPIYAIDQQAQATQVAELQLTEPCGTLLDVAAMGWLVDKDFAQGVWLDGLPYPLQDMRPQGFLGRQFAATESAVLGVSSNPKNWDDDDVLHVLYQRGFDTSGNLILGDVAVQRWLQIKATPLEVLNDSEIETAYVTLASQASGRGVAGSSAAGEFPKFTAARYLDGANTVHVIVKYTGADQSDTVQRWADLLVCEHLALEVLRSVAKIATASSRILQVQGRTFIEVERFDRHGLFGRSALCSLETIEAYFLASSSRDWCDAALMMYDQGWLTAESLHQIRLIWWFGRLIGNSDMHRGNLSFVPTPLLQIAPVYDMLPMMFAPLPGGEIPSVTLTPELPLPAHHQAWLQASVAAKEFWQMAAQDARISMRFRSVCASNLASLNSLIALQGYSADCCSAHI